MYYPSDQATGLKEDSLRIYRWDESTGTWLLVGGMVDSAFSMVSSDVDHLSVFAVLGQMGGAGEVVFLPVVIKRR
jgi:hypothetical protein